MSLDPLHVAALPRRVAFAGPWNGDFDWARQSIRHAAAGAADVLVQLGDLAGDEDFLPFTDKVAQVLDDADLPVIFIDGDGDPHELLNRLPARFDPVVTGLRHLNRSMAYAPRGVRWRWDNIRFLALGGAQPTGNQIHSVYAHPSQGENAAARHPGRVDVLIAHDCPFGVDVPGVDETALTEFDRYSRMINRKRLRLVVAHTEPAHVLTGHYEAPFDTLTEQLGYGPVRVRGLAGPGAATVDDAVQVLDIDRLRRRAV